MRKVSICMLAFLIAITVSAMVIAASRKAPDYVRAGGTPATWDDLLF